MSAAHLVDADFTLYVGDAREVLPELAAESVDSVVTSPPYFRQRDYGDDRQLGREPTVEEYVENLVGVFREVRRVLAKHGTAWLNIGDSHVGGGGYAPSAPSNVRRRGKHKDGGFVVGTDDTFASRMKETPGYVPPGLKPKDLALVPARVALALQADGWWVRSEIIWSKPNPMPESATDRPTKAHEQVYMLTKSARYYFDQEAVREPAEWARWGDQTYSDNGAAEMYGNRIKPRTKEEIEKLRDESSGRNVRSVWEIVTASYEGAHFAVMPEELARRCLMAGCPEHVCRTCGNPLGWTDCGHDDYRPGVVLDPFLGSGTTALAARKLGRHCVGIELTEANATLISTRTGQQSLFAGPHDLRP